MQICWNHEGGGMPRLIPALVGIQQSAGEAAQLRGRKQKICEETAKSSS